MKIASAPIVLLFAVCLALSVAAAVRMLRSSASTF
jgi:hypothetical protein